MTMMRKWVGAGVATVVALMAMSAAAAPAPAPASAPQVSQPGPSCLWLRDIVRTDTPDERTIIFHMRDGSTLRNRLQATCVGLKTFGFGYTSPDGQICNRQIIHIVRDENDCMLGGFELMTPQAPATAPSSPAATGH